MYFGKFQENKETKQQQQQCNLTKQSTFTATEKRELKPSIFVTALMLFDC